MTPVSAVRSAARTGLTVAAALAFLGPLVTRLVIGQAFYLTGRGKVANPAGVAEFFTSLGIPMPELNAAFVSRLEYYGGTLLVVGLATRIVAGLLGSTMVVALLTADRQSFLDALRGVGDAGLTDVVPFVYLLFLAWLVLTGPGAVSLDRLLFRRWIADAPSPSTAPLAHAV